MLDRPERSRPITSVTDAEMQVLHYPFRLGMKVKPEVAD